MMSKPQVVALSLEANGLKGTLSYAPSDESAQGGTTTTPELCMMTTLQRLSVAGNKGLTGERCPNRPPQPRQPNPKKGRGGEECHRIARYFRECFPEGRPH